MLISTLMRKGKKLSQQMPNANFYIIKEMSWIQTIADEVNSTFDSVRSPLNSVPSMLLSFGAKEMSGLSATSLSSNIIQRLPEAGIETGANPDGSPNMIGQFVRIIVEELIKELKEHGGINVVFDPGTIVSIGTGASAAGPVTVTSQNINYVQGLGILQ